MRYYIGQAFGLLAAAGSLLCPVWKKKWQMLVTSAAASLMAALNFFFLNEMGTGIILNLVAVAQVGCSLWHLRRGTPVSTAENIAFFVVYIVCGSLGYRSWRDLLPIVAVVFFMLGVFQRDEQKTRLLVLGNAAAWLTYDLIIASGAAIGQAITIGVTAAALLKYGKKKENDTV